MKKKSPTYSEDNKDDNTYESTILTARFGHESVKLIYSTEKNLYIVIGLIVFIAALSIFNLFGLLEFISFGNSDRIVDFSLLVILICIVVPLVKLLLKSKRVLDKWADMFERNTITTSMKIAMSNRNKEDAILALIQSVEQLGNPLQEYIASNKSDLKEFLDVSVDKNVIFDILIDSDHVLNDSKYENNNLKKILQEYGAIIINVVDDSIDLNMIKSFIDSISKYISLTKNHIGLGIMIGESTTQESEKYIGKFYSQLRKDGINHLLIIAKPTFPPSPSPSSKSPQKEISNSVE